MRARFGVVALALGVAACAGSKGPAYVPESAGSAGSNDPAYVLAATYVVPVGDPIAKQFNGVSGLAPLRDGREMLAILDDKERSRVYRIAMEWTASGLHVTPLGTIP